MVLTHGTVYSRPDQLLHKKQWPHGSEHLPYGILQNDWQSRPEKLGGREQTIFSIVGGFQSFH